MILGFSGRKRSGKSQSAAYIRFKVSDTVEINFADPVKVAVYDGLKSGWLSKGYDITPELRAEIRYLNLDTPGEKIDWVNAHKDELRQMLQDYGHGRRGQEPDYWAEIWKSKALTALQQGFNVVCGDVRYPNEVTAIRDLGGLIINVVNPSAPIDPHPSENQDLGDADIEILYRDGRVDQLHRILDHTLQKLTSKEQTAA